MAENAITVKGVSKDFKIAHERNATLKAHFVTILKGRKNRTIETQHALKDISFEIKKGEFFGIVGRNGSGKSTLLKMLAGIYQPSKGEIQVHGKLVPFIELGVGFNPELTGKENVYLNGALLGFSHKEMDAMYHDIVKFAELEKYMDKKLKNYSSGMQVRLAFSLAIRAQADILLVDEVLAVGDAAFQRKCFEYFRSLKKNNKTVVFVSHDMNAIREYCDKAILIDESKLIASGSANKVAVQYTRLFTTESVEEEKKEDRNSKRWGDGTLKIDQIKINHNDVGQEDKNITIHIDISAKTETEDPVVGFLIKNSANFSILGTNTVLKKRRLPKMKTGDKLRLTWTIPNIFSDGQYYVDPAIVHTGGTQTADWWEEAASFRVFNEEQTPYVVSPDITLKIKKV